MKGKKEREEEEKKVEVVKTRGRKRKKEDEENYEQWSKRNPDERKDLKTEAWENEDEKRKRGNGNPSEEGQRFLYAEMRSNSFK